MLVLDSAEVKERALNNVRNAVEKHKAKVSYCTDIYVIVLILFVSGVVGIHHIHSTSFVA